MKIGKRNFATVGDVDEYRKHCVDLLLGFSEEEKLVCPQSCEALDYIPHPMARSGLMKVCRYPADVWYRNNVDEGYEVRSIHPRCPIRSDLMEL